MAPAAAADEVDTGGEKSTFRWLDVARYAAAAVVVVLIVMVIEHAIVVVLRPEEPKIFVVGGFIAVNRTAAPAPADRMLTFSFTVRAINPSGRVRIYYTNITGVLVVKQNGTATLPPRALAGFGGGEFPDMDLQTPTMEQLQNVEAEITSGAMTNWRSSYFELLYKSMDSYIPDAMLQLKGTVITEVYSGHNKTDPAPTVFCCSPITIGGDPDEHKAVDDARCDPFDRTCYT